MQDFCKTPGCENDAKCLGLCKQCYSSIYYWNKRDVNALIERARRLQLFEARMDLLLPQNVSVPRYRRPKEPLAVRPGESQQRKYKRRA